MAFTFTGKHPLAKTRSPSDQAATVARNQQAIKNAPLNQHQVDTSSIIDLTGPGMGFEAPTDEYDAGSDEHM